MSLSEMVLAAIDGARVRFGAGSVPLTASALLRRGLPRYTPAAAGSTVAPLLTNDQVPVELLLGALASGCRVVSLPVPSRSADPAAYLAFVAEACRSHGVAEVVARDDVAELLQS